MQTTAEKAPELKPFLAHLEDLRTMLLRSAAALILGMIIAAPLLPRIMTILKAPLKKLVENPDTFLRSMEVTGALTSAMTMSFWCGLLISLPFLLFFIGAFVFPALTPREQKTILSACGFGVALFFFGVFLGYRFTLTFAVAAMFSVGTWMGIQAEWTLSSYVTFTTQLLIAFGLAFELPLLLLVLGKLGVVRYEHLRDKRRHAILAILSLGAALTPPDVVSQMIMSVPLYILFELCIWIIWWWERNEQKAESQP